MMGKYGVAAGAFLLAAGAAQADELVSDKWLVYCTTDAMTDNRSCNVMYGATIPGGGGAKWASIIVANTGWDAVVLDVGLGRNACPGEPVMLRVDKNKALTLPQTDRGHNVVGGQAEAMVKQFLAGERLLLRVWVYPDCTTKDIAVSLKGFTATWKRYKSEIE